LFQLHVKKMLFETQRRILVEQFEEGLHDEKSELVLSMHRKSSAFVV
jgi:hypothetical protein